MIARYEPLLRRVERLRFGTATGEESARRHDRFIELCVRGEAAAALAERTWHSLTCTGPTIDERRST
ncbi:hypothetical protein [Microbacterium sp.]|uniref:hypothetical protein n=1 Tax=Microbacterium sp. TaxID=51671 RepID=UPI003A87E5BB